jgi:arabinofuranosyltransferase
VTRDDAMLLAAAAGVAGLFVATELRIAGEVGFPLDDSWIHLRFAQNLAAGRGFAFNPGEPVAGSTAPLWTLCLAAAVALGLPGLVAAKALGLLAYAATALVTGRLAVALGLSRGIAVAAGLAMVGIGRLGWGALSGMEVPLATLLVATASLLVVRDRPLLAAVTLGLATLARPEAGLLIILHVASARDAWTAVRRGAVAALLVAPAVAFNLATVGRVVPATAAAKVGAGLLGVLEGTGFSGDDFLYRLAGFTLQWVALLFSDHLALPVLALAGLVILRRTPLGPLGWALVLHPVATAVVAPYGGPAFQTGRYSSHLLPLAVTAGAVGLEALFARLPSPLLRSAAVATLALALAAGLWPTSRSYAWDVQGITAVQVRLGKWVARHTAKDASVGAHDVGAISYFGDRRVIDLIGLVTPEILPYRRQGPQGVLRYLERTCPDYLVIFPEWFPALASRTDLFLPITWVRHQGPDAAVPRTMVIYETAWNRSAPAPRPCPG